MVTMLSAITEQQIWDTLRQINDPEIPVISIVDLGIVRRVEVGDAGVSVEIMPTFIACPAIGLICDEVEARLRALAGEGDVRVVVTREEQWTSDRITARGREDLRRAGYAPPATPAPALGLGDDIFPLALHPIVPCPFCDGRHTRMENAFGPTLCRAIFYCPDCRQPFEHFKAV